MCATSNPDHLRTLPLLPETARSLPVVLLPPHGQADTTSSYRSAAATARRSSSCLWPTVMGSDAIDSVRLSLPCDRKPQASDVAVPESGSRWLLLGHHWGHSAI